MKEYKHLKTGGIYKLISEDALIEATMTSAVIYQSIENEQIWIRPKEEFFDGRFEEETK